MLMLPLTQRILPKHLARNQDSKDMLIEALVSDEGVGFTWDMLAVDISNQEHEEELLKHIISEWITIRGFSLTASWLEEYRLANSKTTKKRKSLRKGLKQHESMECDDSHS